MVAEAAVHLHSGTCTLEIPPDLVPDHHFLLLSPAVEVRCLLPVELAANRATVLSGTKPLEAIVDELGVLLVEVLMSHDVRGAGVHFAAAHLQMESGC